MKHSEYIPTPVGPCQVPGHVSRELDAMNDADLLAAVHDGPFVDPFALHEAVQRGIWRDQRPQRGMGDLIKRMME